MYLFIFICLDIHSFIHSFFDKVSLHPASGSASVPVSILCVQQANMVRAVLGLS